MLNPKNQARLNTELIHTSLLSYNSFNILIFLKRITVTLSGGYSKEYYNKCQPNFNHKGYCDSVHPYSYMIINNVLVQTTKQQTTKY